MEGGSIGLGRPPYRSSQCPGVGPTNTGCPWRTISAGMRQAPIVPSGWTTTLATVVWALTGLIRAIPAHAQLQAEGLDYAGAGASEAVADGLNAFTAMAAAAAEQTPQAYRLQGSKFGFVIYNATTEFLGAAMSGELSLDESMAKIQEKLDADANN